jgi:hypothetical protein
MKNPLKQIAFLLALVGVMSTSVAQQPTKLVKEKVVETYSRLSITFFMGSLSGGNAAPANAAGKIKFSDKYFNHNLTNLDLPIGSEYKLMTIDKKRAYLSNMLTKDGIGRKMVAKWFNRKEDGTMNLDYVHQSGLYNATDQDVKLAGAAKRGDAFLKDAGQNLVNKTYVLILVPNDVKSKDDGKTRGWDIMYDMFCFQLIFTPEVVAKFYDVWPYDDDNAEIKKTKVAAFDTLTFKFADVSSKPFQFSSVSETLTNNKKPKSLETLMTEAVNRMYENSTFSLDKGNEDFRVKTKVSRVHPTRAKIGKKEGLKCDQQFFVYQYKYDEATKKASPVRQAVIRATSKIVDNRTVATGSSPESKFYQTYGGTIEEGMTLQQRLDFGISVMPGYEIGGIGGMDCNFMFRTGPFTKITALYLIGDIGIDSGTYGSKKYNFTRFSIGIAKGLRFARILELTPYVAYGKESTSEKDKFEDISTDYFKLGGMIGFNLTHNVSLFGQVNNYMTGEASFKIKDSEAKKNGKWTDHFNDRTGTSFMIGLRFEF